MASGEERNGDFYGVLGLKKECSSFDLRHAYKKLALKWHPDRCSASGDSKFVEESKKKFQAIQEAYAVLSNEKKRFLYDVGMYGSDSEDDDNENGMREFLGEMAAMMSQTKASENGQESFEDLQALFEEMLQNDIEAFSSMSQSSSSNNNGMFLFSSSPYCDNVSSNNKRNCSNMSSGNTNGGFDSEMRNLQNFYFGVEGDKKDMMGDGGGSARRRTGRKQKVSG